MLTNVNFFYLRTCGDFYLCVNAKVLVRLSEKKIVLVGAYAKGETCCVQMNVNVEQTINLAGTGYACIES